MSQLAHHSTDDVDRLVCLMHSLSINDPTYTASHSHPFELSPVSTLSLLASVSHSVQPVPVTRPIIAVPALTAHPVCSVPVYIVPNHAASIIRHAQPALVPAACPVHAVDHPDHAALVQHDLLAPVSLPALLVLAPIQTVSAPDVHHVQPVLTAHYVHTALVSRPIPAVSASRAHHARAVLVDRPDHVAQALAVCCVHAVSVSCHPAPIVHDGYVAPPLFSFCLTFVPIIPIPTPLLFPLCPSPTLSTSVTTPVQSSPAEAQILELAPVRRDPHACRSNKECAPEENQKQEDRQSPPHCTDDEEDVAIQKEEGEGQQAVIQPNDKKAE